MKIKKTSLLTLIAAAALVAGVTAGFATSAKAESDSPHAVYDFTPGTADMVEESTMISYTDPDSGKTWYSFDGGITFEAMTDEEFAARFPTPEVEWWTYDEYKEWLENEKAALQEMIGERAWTSGRGEFVWTQEIVDEAIAMYEGILEDIKNGMLYSKTINGESDGSLTLAMDSADAAEIYEGDAAAEETAATEASAEPGQGMSFAERFETYAAFGITYKEARGASGAGNVYLNGKLVSQFVDETPGGGVFSFTSRGKGGITVKTVGKLTGVETVTAMQESKP